MTRVVLGNRHAIHSRNHGARFEAMEKGKRATVIDLDESTSTLDALKAITDAQGIWTYHAVGPEGEVAGDDGSISTRTAIHPDAKPAWVASDSDALAAVLAEAFGGIPIRKLEDPYDGRFSGAAEAGRAAEKKASGGGSRAAKQAPLTAMLSLMLALPLLGVLVANLLPMLKVNTGNDFQYQQMASGSASATAVGKWVGLTANTTTPVVGDTTLTGEIATAGGGLIRKAGTAAHTTSASSYTITTVFTVNGSDSIPVTIGKRGIFDALTSGNLIFSTLVTPTATLSAVGDALTLTDTITM